MIEDGVKARERSARRARRRYAAVGFGIGVAVAAGFLASGHEPRKRQ